MRDFIELEEGEASFVQDNDDDEYIDPDRDFSYIDRKIETVLGHYQKDFMGGLSAESLGARYGGYGSFLPMQQRSPPVLSNMKTQSHVSSKSPHDLQSEHLHQNPTSAANSSLPARPVSLSSDQIVQAPSDIGISSLTNQSKGHISVERAPSHQQKQPMMNHSEQNPLKFRVKMASENVLCRDNSAIYSGLGLDMSPCSSPEDSPLGNDGISPGMKESSPSYIIKIMTSILPLDEALVSPLHEDLIDLIGVEDDLGTGLPGIRQLKPLDIRHKGTSLEGTREANKERKPKLKDASKETKAITEKKLEQKIQRHMPAELVKENNEFPANSVNLSASRKEERGTLVAKEIVSNISISAVDLCFKGTNKSTGFRPPIEFDKKSEVGCAGEDSDNSLKQVPVARHKSKEELGPPSSDVAVEEKGNSSKPRGKTEEDKSIILTTKGESITDKRNELGRRQDEANKFVKQQNVVKDKVKEEHFDPVCPKEAFVCRKENGMQEKKSKDVEVGFVSLDDLGEVGTQHDISEGMKYHDVETVELSKQKSHPKAMPHNLMGQGLPGVKEHSSSVIRKKFKDSGRISAAEPLRGSLMANFSAAESEEVNHRSNIPFKSRRVDTVLHREMRKDNEVAIDENPSKIGGVSSKDFVMGVSARETQSLSSKAKEQSSSRKIGFAAAIGPNMEGDQLGGKSVLEKVPVGELPPPENAPVVPLGMDNWVECEKCNKWRLLPFGLNPDDLPKKWFCRMLTWLPGMNKCIFDEDATTAAVHALYLPPAPNSAVQVQNIHLAHPNGSASINASAGAQHVGLPGRATGADLLPCEVKKKNLVKSEPDAAGKSGPQANPRSVKTEHSGGSRNPKNLKKLPHESNHVRKNAAGDDGRPSKIGKKRLADFELSGAPKKMKGVHRKSLENPDLVGILPVEGKGESQNYDPGALRISQKLVQGSFNYPSVKLKDRVQTAIQKDERKDVFGKKRKLKDQWQSVVSVEPSSGKGQQALNSLVTAENSGTEHRKHKKSNASNSRIKESSADKQSRRTQSDGRKHDLGRSGDNSLHKGGRSDGIPLEQCHAGRISQKSAEVKNFSEKALDLGLSENATTSSSSKVSCKVKVKTREVKCSPVGSISSSPLKACKSDPEKLSEAEESSRKRMKSRAQGAFNEFAPHDETIRDRKSNLSKPSGAVDEDHFAMDLVSGRHPSTHGVDAQPKLEDYVATSEKLDRRFHEGILTAQQNSENQAPKSSSRLHFERTNSERDKSRVFERVSEKEISLYSRGVPEFEKGSGSNSLRVNDDNGRLAGQVANDQMSLRHPHPTGHESKDIEASSSRKLDSFHQAASTALKEAKDLKHSADRLKTAGSGLESTGIFFQAALKFLHGATLLEPGHNESSRDMEMTSTKAYSTTAKLCEYCAHEYEKCNDMASAALAYKCMEVAYMRVVYCNDVVASRDRQELQTVVRDAPQVDSPSSSASDIDNLNNQVTIDTVKDGHSAVDHRSHVISTGNRPNFVRLLSFTHDINLAMEASRKSMSALVAANPILAQAGNEEGITSIKRVLDFSFHDVDGLLHLVRLAMEALNS